MKTLFFVLLGILISPTAFALGEKTELDCQAVEVEQEPEYLKLDSEKNSTVKVTSVTESAGPMLPAFTTKYTITIGDSYFDEEAQGVQYIRDNSDGVKKEYVISFEDGSSITVAAQAYGSGMITSSDSTIQANISCF